MNHNFTRHFIGCVLAALVCSSAGAEGGEGYAVFRQFMEHEYLPLMKAHQDSFLEPSTNERIKIRVLQLSRKISLANQAGEL